MPLFNWSAISMSEVMGDHFWVYWAVAVPLTMAVVGIMGLYALYQSRRNKEAAYKARSEASLKEV